MGNIAKGQYGGVLYIDQAPTYINIKDSIFENNQGLNGGVAYLNHTETLNINNCTFNHNQGQQGGVFHLDQIINIKMENSIMYKNVCNNKQTNIGQAGAILVDNIFLVNQEKINIFINNITFNGNSAFDAAAIEIKNINFGQNITLQNLNFSDNIAMSKSAGAIKLINIKIPSFLNHIQMIGNQANQNGGSIFLENVLNSTLTNITIANSFAGLNGGSIFLNGNNQNLLLTDIQIKNSTCKLKGGSINIVSGQNLQLQNIQIYDSKSVAGALSFTSSQIVSMKNIFIQNSKNQKIGGIQLWQTKKIQLKNITISDCVVQETYGGIALYQSQFIQIHDSIFQNNQAVLAGGGVYILNSKNITLNNIITYNNSVGDSGGGIAVLSSENLIFNNSIIQQNFAQKSGGGLDFQYVKNVQLINTKVNENQAILKNGGGFILDSCQIVNFQNITINNNQAITGGGIYFTSLKDVVLQNLYISGNQVYTKGGGFYLIDSQKIDIIGIKIKNNTAQQVGGGLVIINSQQTQLQNFIINRNNALINSGGGIYINDRSKDIILQDGEISYNQALQSGGGMWVDSIYSIVINNVQFISNQARNKGGSIFLDYSDSIQIQKSIFKLNYYKIQEGSSIYGSNLKEIDISNSNFEQNQAILNGGSIKVVDSQLINIIDNQFNYNQVLQEYISMGGTLHIQRVNQLIFNNNVVNNSFAHEFGGGIYLENILQTKLNNNIFFNNTVVFDENLDIDFKLSNYQITQGGVIYYEILDIEKDNTDIINLEIISNKFQNSKASSGGAILLNFNFQNQIDYVINQNTFSFNQADLGSCIRFLGIKDQKQFRDLNQIDTNNFNENYGLLLSDNIFTKYYTNEKLINEQYAQFELCQQGQNLQNGGQIQCDQCDVNGICDGGYHKMYPKPHYWRFDTNSEEFYYCENNPSVCLGEDMCKQGHLGLLCEKCDLLNKYSASGKDCKKCAPIERLWLNICILFLFTCMLLGNQIYGLSSRIKKKLLQKMITNLYDLCYQKTGQLSGITKILLMHFQIMYLVATYSIELPYEITSSIQIIGNQQKMFSNSLNCMMKAENNEDVKMMEYYLSYWGLGLTIGTLVLLLVFEQLLYFNHKFIKEREQLYGYIKGSIVCFFLMIQPGLLQNSLAFVLCRDVGGQSFNLSDSNIKCNEKLFTQEILPVNIVVIIIIGFLIPILLGIILYKYKKKNVLWRVNIQRSVGILYLEVKEKFYYWEIITIIIKILVVIISITFQSQIVIKGCLCCIVLIIYLLICNKHKPYATLKLNNLSVFATYTQTLSIILVMCLYELEQNQIENWEHLQLIPILIIATINFVFIFYNIYYIIQEFEWMFRNIYFSYIKVDSKIKTIINNKIKREKKAKYIWRLIKIGIHHSTIAKRRLFDQNPLIKINKDEIFYLYVQNAIDNSKTIRYYDKIDLDNKLQFMPQHNTYIQTSIVSSFKPSPYLNSIKNPSLNPQKIKLTVQNNENEQFDTKASNQITQQSTNKKNQDIYPKLAQDCQVNQEFNNNQNQQVSKNLYISNYNSHRSRKSSNQQNMSEISNFNFQLNNEYKQDSVYQNVSRQEFVGSNRSNITYSIREKHLTDVQCGDFNDDIIFEDKFQQSIENKQIQLNLNEEKQIQDKKNNLSN